jgi:hypothetical protein
LLAERGQCADARTIIRAATETAITLGALVVDEAIIDLLLRRHATRFAPYETRGSTIREPSLK